MIILPKIPTSRLKGIIPKPATPVSLRRSTLPWKLGPRRDSGRRNDWANTNVLLRYLVQDDPEQSPRATEIITRRLSEEEPGFVSLVTIIELVWVLESVYKRSRQEIASDIEMVLAADTFEVQNEQEVYHAVVALRNGTGSFEDALIGSLGIWRGCSVTLTLDEKLHRACTVSDSASSRSEAGHRSAQAHTQYWV